MTKAEERALEAYPQNEVIVYGPLPGANEPNRIDDNLKYRIGYAEGYEQAEKDLALTWKDMRRIIRIDEEMMDDPEVRPEWKEEQPYYEEVLRRFNKAKEEKK